MHYLIDGYNFLFRLSHAKNLSFSKKRDYFIQECQKLVANTGLKITLIFDARTDRELFARAQQWGDLNIVFTAGQTADDWIIELLEYEKKQKPYCVVTSDKLLAESSKLLGAKTLSIDSFLHLIEKKQNPEPKKGQENKNLPFPAESFIMQAYLKRLLNIFESRSKDDS